MEKLIKLNAELMKINATNQEEIKERDKNHKAKQESKKRELNYYINTNNSLLKAINDQNNKLKTYKRIINEY